MHSGVTVIDWPGIGHLCFFSRFTVKGYITYTTLFDCHNAFGLSYILISEPRVAHWTFHLCICLLSSYIISYFCFKIALSKIFSFLHLPFAISYVLLFSGYYYHHVLIIMFAALYNHSTLYFST